MEELLGMWRGREFQVVGAATAKLRESKHVWTVDTWDSQVSPVMMYVAMFTSKLRHISTICCIA